MLGNPNVLADLRLFNSQGIEVAFQAAPPSDFFLSSTDTNLIFTAPSTGVYYLGISNAGQDTYNLLQPRVREDQSIAMGYRLIFKSLHETVGAALPVGSAGSSPLHVAGNLLSTDQVDMYSVTVAAGQLLTVDVTDLSAIGLDAVVRLFDAAGHAMQAVTS